MIVLILKFLLKKRETPVDAFINCLTLLPAWKVIPMSADSCRCMYTKLFFICV